MINIIDPTVFQVPPPDDDDDPTNDHIVFFGDDIIDIPFPHEILYDHIEKKWYIRMKIYLTNYWYEEEDKPYGPFRWIINEDPKVSWLKINGYESDTNNQYEGVVYKNSGEIEVLLQLRGLMPTSDSFNRWQTIKLNGGYEFDFNSVWVLEIQCVMIFSSGIWMPVLV